MCESGQTLHQDNEHQNTFSDSILSVPPCGGQGFRRWILVAVLAWMRRQDRRDE